MKDVVSAFMGTEKNGTMGCECKGEAQIDWCRF